MPLNSGGPAEIEYLWHMPAQVRSRGPTTQTSGPSAFAANAHEPKPQDTQAAGFDVVANHCILTLIM